MSQQQVSTLLAFCARVEAERAREKERFDSTLIEAQLGPKGPITSVLALPNGITVRPLWLFEPAAECHAYARSLIMTREPCMSINRDLYTTDPIDIHRLCSALLALQNLMHIPVVHWTLYYRCYHPSYSVNRDFLISELHQHTGIIEIMIQNFDNRPPHTVASTVLCTRLSRETRAANMSLIV